MRRRARRDVPTFPALPRPQTPRKSAWRRRIAPETTHTPRSSCRSPPSCGSARGYGSARVRGGITVAGIQPRVASCWQAGTVGACISGAVGCSLWPAPAAAMPPECSRCHACDQTTSARPTPPCEPAQLQPGSQRAAFSPRIRTRTHNTFITPRSTSPLDARPTTRRSPHAAFFRRTRRGRGAVWRV